MNAPGRSFPRWRRQPACAVRRRRACRARRRSMPAPSTAEGVEERRCRCTAPAKPPVIRAGAELRRDLTARRLRQLIGDQFTDQQGWSAPSTVMGWATHSDHLPVDVDPAEHRAPGHHRRCGHGAQTGDHADQQGQSSRT